MRLAGTNFLPSVRSGGICRTVQRPGSGVGGEEGTRGGFPLGPRAWVLPSPGCHLSLRSVCRSLCWRSTTVRMEEKGFWLLGGREVPGPGWVEELSLGRRWSYSEAAGQRGTEFWVGGPS